MKPKIEKIVIKHETDIYPDLGFLGEFSNEPKEGAIETNMGSKYSKYFNPQNPEYAEQDYQRMRDYERGLWWFIGIRAEAEVIVPNGFGNDVKQYIRSSGLFGIESDSDASYIYEEKKNQLAELRAVLKNLGIRWNSSKAEKALETW